MKPIRHQQRGFTLIELMVTVSIAVILMFVVIPSLTTFQRNAELTSLTNNLVSAINVARSEAMKRNRKAFVIPVGGADWNNGLLVFVDNGDQVFNDANDLVIMKTAAAPGYLTLTGTDIASGGTPYLLFDGQGYSRTKTATIPAPTLAITIARNDVTGSTLLEQTRKVKIAITGRVASCKPGPADPSC